VDDPDVRLVAEEQELVYAFLSTMVHTRANRKVQVIQKDDRDDRISTSDHLAPKPLLFRLAMIRPMPSSLDLAIDSLVTEITMDMKIHERMGEDRRWSIKWTSALARPGRMVFLPQAAVICSTASPAANPLLE
jgi:hypothetical protein